MLLYQSTAHPTKKLVQCALFTALSIVLSHVLTIPTPILRINIGSVPILLAGILFGPFAGGAVGAVADLVGGTLAGYSINPMITIGTAMVGFCGGIAYRHTPTSNKWRVLSAVVCGNLIGSVVINSIALHIYFGWSWVVLSARIPNNLFLGTIEFFILWYLLKHRGLQKLFGIAQTAEDTQ